MLNINLKLLSDFWLSFLFARPQADPLLPPAFICLTLIFLSSLWVIPLLKKTLDPAGLFSLAPMAGLATIILVSFPVFLLSIWAEKSLNYQAILAGLLLFLTALSLPSALRSWQTASSKSAKPIIALACLFFVFCALRLPFIKGLVLPPYSDSVEHYQIIRDLSHPEMPPLAFYKLERMASRYYHMGFHVLAASLSTLSGSPIEQVMLVLGQLFQAIIPLSLFFPIKAITKNNLAGLGVVLFAGLCWRMPSFASNWGKYPALTSLSMLPLLPGLLYTAQEAENHRQLKNLTFVAIAAGVATVFAHTRSLVLLIIFFGSWHLAGRVARIPSLRRAFAIAVIFLLIMGLGIIINTNGVLSFIFTPYLRDGFLPLILVALLIPFGLNKYPRLMTCTLLILLFILVGSVFPLPAGLGRLGFQHLLDRPYAQTALFLPLSALGGISLAGLYDGLKHIRGFIQVNVSYLANCHPERQRRVSISVAEMLRFAQHDTIKSKPIKVNLNMLALPLFAFGAFFYSLSYYDLAPSTCCQLAGLDDVKAYRWIEENLPASAVVLIASNQTPTRSYGVDGGAWITPLTGIQTVMRSNQTPFSARTIFEELCMQGITHIYGGGNAARFHVEEIASTSWYANRFNMPGAYLYELTACP